MEPIYIIVIIIVLIIFLITSIIVIRDRRINFRIMKVSKKFLLLVRLNSMYKFNNVSPLIKIKKHYDNKGHFNKISPGDLMTSHIRNNITHFSLYTDKIKENKVKLQAYKNEVNLIIKEKTETNYKDLKISINNFIKRENKLIKEIVLSPIIDCKICVYMTYSSPKKQVNLNKNECFNFSSLISAYQSISRSKLDKAVRNKLFAVERGEVSDSLRYDILQRDNFRCVICGSSSKDGVRLHIDHIIPISKGGKSNFSNLRTLCERCNIGKSNKIEI